MTYFTLLESSVGPLLLVANDTGLTGIAFDGQRACPSLGSDARKQASHPVLRQAKAQLQEYFAGARRTFDLPLAPVGTPFQRDVWNALLEIPYGKTQSYGEIARRIGRAKAVRAVGAANGANPLPVVVPCHRVIGADGSLTGYGGELWRKRKLLALEGGA